MDDSVVIRGGTLVTMDQQNSIVRSDLLIRGDRIAGIGVEPTDAQREIDAHGCAVLPGFVQTHIHLCQTIFRGAADDLSLIDWLKKRVWPLEASHSASSVRASARLGIAELIKGGTTCALTMETVNHTEQVFQVVEESGYRATVGKCMMDKGDGVPAELHENTKDSIAESLALLEHWHKRGDGRIRYCFAPRFAVSCTAGLLSRVGELAIEHGVMVHSHASENRDECDLVERETGMRNIMYLGSLGLTGKHVALAHCIHLNADEIEILARSQTRVVHCPSSNLKLGSGVAPIVSMLERGVPVSIGADGAACNNRLDMFTEMRTAALLQKSVHGPEVIPARLILRLATIEGARALGLQEEIGSLEIGKKADVTVVNLQSLHATPRPEDLVSALVYAAQPADVEHVLIDGRVVMENRKLLALEEARVIDEANRESKLLLARGGLSNAQE